MQDIPTMRFNVNCLWDRNYSHLRDGSLDMPACGYLC